MKRIVSLLLASALVLALLPACRQAEQDPSPSPFSSPDPSPSPSLSPDQGQKWTPLELAELVFQYAGWDGTAAVESLCAGEDTGEMLAAYAENAYGLAPDQWEDAAVIRATGASAFEIAVLRLKDEETAVRAASSLTSYMLARQGDFAGYAPAQADMVAKGSVGQSGPYAALFICPAPERAYAAFEAVLSGQSLPEPDEPAASAVPSQGAEIQTPSPAASDNPHRTPFTPPNKDDMSIYDTAAILAAWENGDPAELSDYDREIYDSAKEVLDQLLEDGMSDYEKELAVYDWIVNNVNYDWTHQNILLHTPRESYTPYGGLVRHTAVCLGYAATFQLLMDLSGVECITVVGAAFDSREDHGWNMVRLDGRWYCLDVTWDANKREQLDRGSQGDWWYFNVTSDYMAWTNHQWDYANTPEAED